MSIINAIGIYIDCRKQKSGSFQRLNSSPQHKGGIFSSNPLSSVEKNTLTRVPPDLQAGAYYSSKVNDEYHYLSVSAHNFLMVIVSRKEISQYELGFLFKNIEHAQVRPTVVRATLDTIVTNPYGFTGRDIQISAVLKQVEELKEIALDNMEKLLERGDKLEELQPKTIQLKASSKKFVDEAEKLNKCCWLY